MTKTITKKPIIATIAATILIGTILVISNTFTNDIFAGTALPSSPCPADGQVEHWDKIIFQVEDDPSKILEELELLKTPMDLKILEPPDTVVVLKEEVSNALADKFGHTSEQASALKIEIIDVKYQTVTCGLTGPPQEIKTSNAVVMATTTDVVITCTDNSSLTRKSNRIKFDDFGSTSIPKNWRITELGSSSVEISMDIYTVDVADGQFVLTGTGDTKTSGTGTCQEDGVVFSWTATGQCAKGVIIDMTTSLGFTVTINTDTACV